MKNTKTQVVRLGIVFAMLAAGHLSAQTATVLQEWRFGSEANPAAPEIAPETPTLARATIQEGRFSSGWINQDVVLGGGKGIWDLGRKGVVTLNHWSHEDGPSSTSHEITVKVTQWFDGGIYGTFAAVDVPGARLANRSQANSVPGTIGDWVTDETHWTIDVGASVDRVVVTSPENGALIDKISVEAPIALSVPKLSIRGQTSATNSVEVSWPLPNVDGWQLESNTNIENARGWKPVDGQPQISGDRSVIVVPRQGTLFFRLRHP